MGARGLATLPDLLSSSHPGGSQMSLCRTLACLQSPRPDLTQQVGAQVLTVSPRSPLLPAGPTGPGAPGAPGAPGGPAGPVSPRSPWEGRGGKPRSAPGEGARQGQGSSRRSGAQGYSRLTLGPGEPSRPGEPSAPGDPCRERERGKHQPRRGRLRQRPKWPC